MSGPILQAIPAGGIGDVILMTPMIREWRRQNPDGKIVIRCRSESDRAVLLLNPHVHTLQLPYRGLNGMLSRVFPRYTKRCESYFVRYDYSRDWPAFRGIHASVLIGQHFGVEVTDTKPELYLSESERDKAADRLAAYRTPIAIHVVPASTSNKRWSMAHWSSLIAQSSDFTFVQIGKEKEKLVAGAIDMRGLSLRDSFAVMSRCRAFVGPDSVFAHAAAALDLAAVVLFGPSTPAVWGHRSATNLSRDLPCAPCIDLLVSGRCPYGQACMRAIAPNEVRDALVRRIERSAHGRLPIDQHVEMNRDTSVLHRVV